MMNKYNRGVTIVEILISVAIIGIILLLLFSMLLQVRNEDRNNNIQSNFIINQSTFIKIIEEDITKYGVKAVSYCTLADVNVNSSTVVAGDEENFKCIRIEYAADYLKDKVGYLIIYNYYDKYDVVDGSNVGVGSKWMMKYVRGYYDRCTNGKPVKSTWQEEVTIMKEIPEEINMNLAPTVLYTAATGTNMNAASISVPIENLAGERYDIDLGFTFKGADVFKCKQNTNSKQKNQLVCSCLGDNTSCEGTKTYTYTCTN